MLVPLPIPGILATALLAVPPQDYPPPPVIVVQALEEAWKLGDERTYTLKFDRAPLGLQAVRLTALRDLPGGGREAVFRQRAVLDLRGLGHPGTFEHAGEVAYRQDGSGPYRYQEIRLAERRYDTYRRPPRGERLEADLDPAIGAAQWRQGDAPARAVPLPEGVAEALAEIWMLPHWEMALLARSSWGVGDSAAIPLLVPAPAPRLDFHLPPPQPRPPQPAMQPVQITVEAREEIDILGVRLEAFRCRVDPLGLFLWVSNRGGVLRFQDGRGLEGALDP